MATINLRELPGVSIDADAIAKGLLNMFDDEEKTVLRFGMLPAKKIECLQQQMRASFQERFAMKSDGDKCEALLTDGERREFSMKRLVSEAVREVTLALYRNGNLVV